MICEIDETAAAGVMAQKDGIRRLADEALRHKSERIGVPEPHHLKLVQLEMELLEHLRRIYTGLAGGQGFRAAGSRQQRLNTAMYPGI